MQYNIFRIKDKDGLFKEMMNNNYIKSKVEKQVDDYCLNLYYSKKDSSKISWQNILNEFDVDIIIDKVEPARIKPVVKKCAFANDANIIGAIYHYLTASK